MENDTQHTSFTPSYDITSFIQNILDEAEKNQWKKVIAQTNDLVEKEPFHILEQGKDLELKALMQKNDAYQNKIYVMYALLLAATAHICSDGDYKNNNSILLLNLACLAASIMYSLAARSAGKVSEETMLSGKHICNIAYAKKESGLTAARQVAFSLFKPEFKPEEKKDSAALTQPTVHMSRI